QTRGTHALSGLSVSPGEIVFMITFLSWLIKAIAIRKMKLRVSSLTGWVLLYGCALIGGLLYGVVHSGNFTIALWQIRAQALFIRCMFLGANLLREPRHLPPVIWTIVVCTGIQGIFGTITWISLGMQTDYNGIMPHDDSLLFNFLLFVLFLGLITK